MDHVIPQPSTSIVLQGACKVVAIIKPANVKWVKFLIIDKNIMLACVVQLCYMLNARDVPIWLFTDIPIADTVQNIKADKHNRSDIISKSILLCISCKNKVKAIPQAKDFIIC